MKKEIASAATIVVVAAAMGMMGCTWVPLEEEAEKVRVLDASEVGNCKELGTTEVSVKAKLAGIGRNAEKVQKELATLARNAAEDKGGDSVVALGEVEDGAQRFAIYDCVQ